MRRMFFLLGFLLSCLNSVDGSAAPAATFNDWVPAGWKLLRSAAGDLNGDGKPDEVLVLEQSDPAKFRKNDGLGAPVLNLNPRRLIVLLQTEKGLTKVADVARFLPGESDSESPCLEDPLSEGGVRIAGGLLEIDLQYWLSCGSYGVSHNKFRFRHEANSGRFVLIGLDGWEFMRNSGERSETSKNYLTGKQKVTEGLNEFEPSKPRTSWKNIPSHPVYYLDEITANCDSTRKPSDWCE